MAESGEDCMAQGGSVLAHLLELGGSERYGVCAVGNSTVGNTPTQTSFRRSVADKRTGFSPLGFGFWVGVGGGKGKKARVEFEVCVSGGGCSQLCGRSCCGGSLLE